ncbi:DUF4145 domain-containing protein [Ferrimonas sediminicola]|uniref:DUF4145 domain-containing protein n=1 Tax=Ferrimonas sediminicola TaxID=2569538 RepID=A0A4U1BD69_9GAMM|nr:DUF4145 domain-containing protein [Ferrimonas sediminicola]TKB47947.1 DUF4145 domain-containing protein [Ferrimonas sediminicola]
MAINDLELVRRLEPSLLEDYRLARNYCLDVPTHALVHLRSVAYKLVEALAAAAEIKFKSRNLYDRVEVLNRARAIDVRLARRLHKLREGGNKGAHPEKYRLSQEQLVELARKSVQLTAGVLADAYTPLSGQPCPQWRFEPLDQVAGRELCYRAVMEEDAEAQYLVGVSLKAKGMMLRERELSFAMANDSADINTEASRSLLAQAGYWFERASDSHLGARFEFGVALIHGYGSQEDRARGETLVQQAAASGLAEAQALLGYFYLSSSTAFDQDLLKAEHFLLLAAEQDQAEAMANLGVLYHHHRPDPPKALAYTRQAAQAGYPVAQYHLALLLDQQGTEEEAMDWLQQSAAQHYPDAMAALARHLLDGERLPADPARASALYRKAIRYAGLPEAMFEFSLAIFDNEVPDADPVEGAALLQAAYHYAGSRTLRDAIERFSPTLVAALESGTGSVDRLERLQLARRRFDDHGLPLPFESL